MRGGADHGDAFNRDAVLGGPLPVCAWCPTAHSGQCGLGGHRSRPSTPDPAHRLHAAELDEGPRPLPRCDWHHPARTSPADRCRRWRRRGSHRRDSPGRPTSHERPPDQAKHHSRVTHLGCPRWSTCARPRAGPAEEPGGGPHARYRRKVDIRCANVRSRGQGKETPRTTARLSAACGHASRRWPALPGPLTVPHGAPVPVKFADRSNGTSGSGASALSLSEAWGAHLWFHDWEARVTASLGVSVGVPGPTCPLPGLVGLMRPPRASPGLRAPAGVSRPGRRTPRTAPTTRSRTPCRPFRSCWGWS